MSTPSPLESRDFLQMTPLRWKNIRFFKPYEFYWPDLMDYVFLHQLDSCRQLYGLPMVLTSTNEPRENDTSSHNKGCAVDVRVHTAGERLLLVKAALQAGFRRIGLYDRHVHLDSDREKPPCLWLGESA